MTDVTPRHSQLLRGLLDLCLLATIERGPTYGYEMTRRLTERGLAVVAEGSIYPALGRLQREGLVETSMEAGEGGPPRKYYRLSEAGRFALQSRRAEWVRMRSAVDAVLADAPGTDAPGIDVPGVEAPSREEPDTGAGDRRGQRHG